MTSTPTNTEPAAHTSTSIIIPTHDRLPTLNRALTSAKHQTHPNTEIIVIDDASTDGTSEWLQTHHPDINLIQLPENQGAAASNLGIEQAQGQYIAFLDSDDRWHPTYLTTQIAALQQHPQAILAYSDYYAHYTGTEKREHIQLQPDHPDLTFCFLKGSFIHSCSLITLRRDILRQIGSFNPTLRTSYDKDLYLRLVKLGSFIRTPRPLVDKYWTPGSLVTQDNCERWREGDLKVLDIFFSNPESKRYQKHRPKIEQLVHRRIDESQQFFDEGEHD